MSSRPPDFVAAIKSSGEPKRWIVAATLLPGADDLNTHCAASAWGGGAEGGGSCPSGGSLLRPQVAKVTQGEEVDGRCG
jgi:hypothetical protein